MHNRIQMHTALPNESMTTASPAVDTLRNAIDKLLTYCQSNDWAGYDPYDALNSGWLAAVPLLDRKLPRLALTQVMKRLPLNVRPMLWIPKRQNAKGLALFLTTLIRLQQMSESEGQEPLAVIPSMIERLVALRSPGSEHFCWGYSFPWQTRTVLVQSNSPNLVCTIFVANALLDAYDAFRQPECLQMAISAGEYLLSELYWSDGETAGFGYPLPSVHNQVHNANLLAAAMLCRVYAHTRDERFLEPALQAARSSAASQNEDGSWFYGGTASQRWIDNFHTGYNLCALRAIGEHTGAIEFQETLQRGYAFYRNRFFNADGSVRYFHDRTYPIDIHAVAQSIVTLVEFRDLDSGGLQQAHGVLQWALEHLWDPSGFFYYRKLPRYTNRISYMRWSQAWMLLAMVLLLEASSRQQRASLSHAVAMAGIG